MARTEPNQAAPSTRRSVLRTQYSVPGTQYAASLALLPLLAAAANFRGPGWYYNLVNLGLILAVFLAWIRISWWVDQDARRVSLPLNQWNGIMVGCGALGLLLAWALPMFLAGFVLLVGLALLPALAYVSVRNPRVAEADRVLTPAHLRSLLSGGIFARRRKVVVEEEKGLPIRFIGKSAGEEQENKTRVARAQQSTGYKVALRTVWDAIEVRATDIHLEPTKTEMSVRFRIDGILHPGEPMDRQLGDSVVNIFKVLADMDITEKRKPQDGSFSAQVRDRIVDFRVATAGSVIGEKLVMRILDKSKQLIDFENLGMRDRMRETMHSLAIQPHGLIVVCGPTGAGKSTTLYACLNEIDRYQVNVITLENPVEYQIDNATQIEINPKAGKTFAGELRSILRQDPDVILVGEVRDQETAESACQAAQTGHMVFTTVHANDTVTAVGRLIDLGVAPFLVGNALTAVLGQRLVRVLCPKCKVRYKPNPEMLRKANLPADKIKYFYRPPEPGEDEEPCDNCKGTGYRGRTGIFELMVMSEKIRDLIRENPNLNAVRQEAVRQGMKYLYEDGMRQVIEGKTSIQELLRVCK